MAFARLRSVCPMVQRQKATGGQTSLMHGNAICLSRYQAQHPQHPPQVEKAQRIPRVLVLRMTSRRRHVAVRIIALLIQKVEKCRYSAIVALWRLWRTSQEAVGKVQLSLFLIAQSWDGSRDVGKFNGQSHATGKSRQCATVWSQDTVREVLPVTCRKGTKSLSDAWGNQWWCAQRQPECMEAWKSFGGS